MGYNNNHAGMHMIRQRRKNSYYDLEYYDGLAEEKIGHQEFKMLFVCHGSKLLFGKNAGKSRVVGV